MNKGELIKAVAFETTASQKDVEEILTETLDVIVHAVSNKEKVTLVGFGTFEARDRAEREGRNPQTGESLTIPACKFPAFSAGKGFKEAVNEFA